MISDASGLSIVHSKALIGARNAGRVLRRDPVLVFPLLVVLALFLAAAFPTLLAPQDYTQQNLRAVRLAPGEETSAGRHLLGTDWLGRDLLSRAIVGARISVLVALTAVGIRGLGGSLLGLLSGYYGGWLDNLLMRIADIDLSLPYLLIVLVMAVVLGPSTWNVIFILGATGWVTYSRLVRGEVLSIRERQYVEAARAIGARDVRILFRHIWPNTIAPVIIIATVDVPFMILAESTLSFLGVGIPITTPSWGNMVFLGKDYLTSAWWIPITPGVLIAVTVLSLNILGDWMRDTLDPALRGRGLRS